MKFKKENLEKTIKYVTTKGTVARNKMVETSKKAAVFLQEKSSVACVKTQEVSKKVIAISKEKGMVAYNASKAKGSEMLEGKDFSFVKKIHFNFHHMVSVCMIALVAFFVTLYSTGYNTTSVDASVMEVPTAKEYNKTAMNVSYGQNSTVANVAKEILGDQISTVEEPKEISTTGTETVYEIADYVVVVNVDATLGSANAKLTLETKDSYASTDMKKIVTPAVSKNVVIEDGAKYTYNIKLNITDNEAPLINLTSEDITIMDTDTFDAKSYVNSVTDNADGVIVEYAVENDIAKDGEGKLESGKHTLTYRAKDSSGNEGVANMIVRVYTDEEPEAEAATPATTKANTGSNAQASVNVPASSKGAAIAAAAMGQIGVTQDCTALVSNSLRAVGINFHGWPSDYLRLGTVVPYSQAQPGDIVVYNGHVAIYVGNGMCVHGGFNGNQTVLFSIVCSSGAFSIVRVA